MFIVTPPRTHKISGLKSQVLKPTFLLKTDDEKWSRIFYLEILLAPSEIPVNLPATTLKGLVEFQNKKF